MTYQNTLEFAKQLDASDPLRKYRERFYFPQMNGREVVYFTGNSLGLQPKSTQDHVLKELEDWATFGVEGHFHARNPWFSYHELFSEVVSKIVGAKPTEVVVMNQLTINLHFLMASFYRPTKHRYKILCEYKAFPSDQYALETQAKFHGFSPNDAVIEAKPRDGEYAIRTEDILSTIEKNKNELALVLIGGVNYFTGQVFEMEKITAAAHKVGAMAGFDLAHAAGNIKLNLHDWNVDFACWCTYKYLNSGPGCVGGAYIHERHHKAETPRLGGWWGHDKQSRFKMEKGFKPMMTAEAWQLSNAPVIAMACHKASVEIFVEAGMEALVEKSKKLTGYLEYIIEEINSKLQIASPKPQGNNLKLEIITPKDARGCQLSIVAHGKGKSLYEKLAAGGVIADWREPNVIRCAPVPLYNSFEDVWRFGEILAASLRTQA
ncbi:MAG: kynureninase [Bacteroidetes bacterium]|nr:MAG: kynureninase [Bacteroidota bacterium]